MELHRYFYLENMLKTNSEVVRRLRDFIIMSFDLTNDLQSLWIKRSECSWDYLKTVNIVIFDDIQACTNMKVG